MAVKRLARLFEVAIIVGVMLLGIAAVSVSLTFRYKARETGIKENLHQIQLAVERYGIDAIDYPLYLIGGATRWSRYVDTTAAEPFSGEQACPDPRKLSDSLLRDGYLTVYPSNPFSAKGVSTHQAQLQPLNAPFGDPLRNGAASGLSYGTRFGPRCTLMGQLLGTQPSSPTALKQQPGADVTYACWAVWKSRQARNPLPGDFLYVSIMPTVKPGEHKYAAKLDPSEGIPPPFSGRKYIMAAFGGPRTRGRDILDAQGSPFGTADGVSDGIIIVLSSGEGEAQLRK